MWRALSAVMLASLAERVAHAEPEPLDSARDTSHGRLEGDLAFASGVGATFGPREPRATVDMRFRYLSTAGLFATYEQGPPLFDSAEPRRTLALGVELRPLFLARWGTGRELGHPRLDLLIDSIGIELGAIFMQPAGARFGARPGLELGLGAEFPIFAKATGPFIGVHGGVRWSDTALSGGPLDGPSDRSLYVTTLIGWQQVFGAHVVDLGDVSKSSH